MHIFSVKSSTVLFCSYAKVNMSFGTLWCVYRARKFPPEDGHFCLHEYFLKIHSHTLKINSLVPERSEWNFRLAIFKPISVTDGWGISNVLALRWTSMDLTDGKSTLVQIMAWCRRATSYYLSQCWHRSLSSYGVTRPQWVQQLDQQACHKV